ncbi:MAG: phosphatidate cytidylyltransferase [Phycisphaeraceae bacterium]|nr:phosphatidate cytidylyltransferase [Phycisphaeraceae bacterium]
MLRHRMIFGPLMILALFLILFVDSRLDKLTITGTVWQSFFFGRDYLPKGLGMLALFIVLIVLASGELFAIFQAKGIAVTRTIIALAGIAGCTVVYAIPYATDSPTAVAVFATVLVVVFVIPLFWHNWRHRQTQGAVAAAAVTLFAFIYLGLLAGFYLAIRRWHSAWVVAAILLIIKSCDIGAYFTGRFLGRHKLIPWLSPGKTWEGFAGGVLLSAAVATFMAWLYNRIGMSGYYLFDPRRFLPVDYPLWAAPIGGALLGAVGQFGDLTASLFKRDAGFKDSGQSIPGFGGLLDVLDSPLIVAPLAYWLLRLTAVG